MDSNHDKAIQNRLCYRYTTRQVTDRMIREQFVTAKPRDVNCLTESKPSFLGAVRTRKSMLEGCLGERWYRFR
jgi:hypothetical protein